MNTLLVTHEDCLKHNPGDGHPERPQRLMSVLETLRPLPGMVEFKAPLVSRRQIARVHHPEYWEAIAACEPADGLVQLDPDTLMSPGSVNAALRAAGAVCVAVEQVVTGKFANAFCAVRPPGHHAEANQAMGFCLLNSVAIGAAEALTYPSINRVVIIDFDVHHGNGTQAMFADNRNVIYVSTHQRSLYPGTGEESDTGRGNIHNTQLPPNSGSDQFRAAFRDRILPILRSARPDLVMISAGFDAHRGDPLAQLNLETEDYRWVTEQICRLADEYCGGRVVSALEGGYDLDSLAEACQAHVEVLIESGRRHRLAV